MNELVPQKNKFDSALAKIEEASQHNRNLLRLKKFDEKDKIFSLFPKRVTGEEMNEFANQVQSNLIVTNNKINKIYQQFTDVYFALDALDKEYISGIVGAFNEAVDAMKKAENAQEDINKTVKLLNATVTKIKEFNNKVSYEFSRLDSENWRENALKHKKELDELDRKAEDIIQAINSYKDMHADLSYQLNNYEQEKRRTTLNLKFCWWTTGVMTITTVVLILLIIFNVI